MAPIAVGNVPPVDRISAPSSKQSIEEVCFTAALICLDGHFNGLPSIPGAQTQVKVAGMVARTLEKTHGRKDVREALARNVEIWVYLTRIFNNAIDNLTLRSFSGLPGSAYDDKASAEVNQNGSASGSVNGSNGQYHNAHSHMHSHMGHDSPELMIKNHAGLKEDLQILNKLMHIARNLLVCSVPEVPQDICAAVSFDAVVFQVIVLCVNAAGKGYHDDVLDDVSRNKLSEIFDLYKKLLVTSLQQIHNWTAKNDRNKMAFWYYVFFEDDSVPDDLDSLGGDGTGYRPDLAKIELRHWLERNAAICAEARERLVDYANKHQTKAPGIPSLNSPLARLWIPTHLLNPNTGRDQAKYDHDASFGRVSHENEIWWDRVSDPNRDEWRLPMPDRAYGKRRQSFFKHIILHRFSPRWRMRDEDAAQGHSIHMTGEYFRVPGKGDAELDSKLENFRESDEAENNGDNDEEDNETDDVYDTEADLENDKDEYEDCEGEGEGECYEHSEHCHDHDHDHVHSHSCGYHRCHHHHYHHHHDHHHHHNHDHEHSHIYKHNRNHVHDHGDDDDDGPYLDANGNPLNEYDDEDLDEEDEEDEEGTHHHHHDHHSDRDEHDDLDNDNDSYAEGPALGILTEIPNILDPKQIEALHMIIKSCILDTMGCGLSPQGESLQQARCKFFLASDIGRSLLRELLVFIAVWDQEESSLIWELTLQILEAIHDTSLIPYAWTELRIPKDVVSPAQAVMLRMINYFFRKKYLGQNAPPAVSIGAPPHQCVDARDMRLVHFMASTFRCRIVPECMAFMSVQSEIRRGNSDASVFPIENWDMERARDGLSQVLELFATLTEIEEIRAQLVDWELAVELVALLRGLEVAIAKKPLVDAIPQRTQNLAAGAGRITQQPLPAPPPHASVPSTMQPAQEPAYKFPWAGIKTQVLSIIATLLQPEPGRSSPGNPIVQNQVMEEKGMLALLNACVYDDHNRFARERVQLCLKYLMDGCEEANRFVRELVKSTPTPNGGANSQGQPPADDVRRVRVDGVEGEVKVRVRDPTAAGTSLPSVKAQAPLALPAPPMPQAVPADTTPALQSSTSAIAAATSSPSRTLAGAPAVSADSNVAVPDLSHGTSVLPTPQAILDDAPTTSRQRKQRQRQNRQQRTKSEAEEFDFAREATAPVTQQVQASAQEKRVQTGASQQLQHQPETSTPRVYGPPPPPMAGALACLTAQVSELSALTAAHLMPPDVLPPGLADQMNIGQRPIPRGVADALIARRMRCESLLGDIVNLSNQTARMAVSIENGEISLPNDAVRNLHQSQKFLEQCRERLARPLSGALDVAAEDGSGLRSGKLPDSLASLYTMMGMPCPTDQDVMPSVAPNSLENQYCLVEQALLYLTDDLAKNPVMAPQPR
ncbi:hypothetical protein SEPCBS119000_001492 [Sporothrix epigloea]|uniref:Ataxin-10 homolog n=1 Tax=Sporothrix epigloea TaxID=1892477 RepID=A0ABP0DB06_9PEZI